MREEITIVKDGQTKVIELEDFPIFKEKGWSMQEEQTSAPVANANWVHSNKLVLARSIAVVAGHCLALPARRKKSTIGRYH